MSARTPQSLPSDRHDRKPDSALASFQSLDADSAPGTVDYADLNRRIAAANANIRITSPPFDHDASAAAAAAASMSQVQFRTQTIAPSPPLPQGASPFLLPTDQYHRDTTAHDLSPRYHPSPLGGNGLHIHTDISPSTPVRTDSLNSNGGFSTGRLSLRRQSSTSSLRPGVSRTPSLKTAIANSLGSASAASSRVPSPIISAMGDVTPLPSPLLSSDSPGPWKRMAGRLPSLDSQHTPLKMPDSVLVSSTGESIASAMAHQTIRKSYAGLPQATGDAKGSTTINHEKQNHQAHTRNRSTSEYIPDPMNIPKRMTTVSGTRVRPMEGQTITIEPQMRREPHLSEARGLTPVEKPPTPPPSESSLSAHDSGPVASTKPRHEYFKAYGRNDGRKRKWRAVKILGQGTFSRVMLATSHLTADDEGPDTGLLTPEPQYDRKTLVAVKVCEHGPKGGASEERVEMSLKRELEIMQSINHPCLVHLKAWNIEPSRAILVLSHCPGGDLFDVASSHRDALTPPLLRRMFAELVGAVRYLHEKRIVHRDIKLENVLVNLMPSELANTKTDWTTYPYPVTTLTDLGLSRRIAANEKLETRCGSDDYAAPEVIMGQPYDGRQTDAWSLGVLLYALLEGRLPFDPHPGAADGHRMRSRTSHRIARVEWIWIEYGCADGEGEGDHDADERKFRDRGLIGAMEIAEGLLKRARSRWTMDKVAATEWVRDAVRVDGGIRFREEEEAEETD